MTLTLHRVEEARLTQPLEAEIADLITRAFDEDFGGHSYYLQRHHVRLLAREDARLVGHVALCLRAIRLGDTILDIAGLAEVATDPASQGKGIATRLLAAARDEANAMGVSALMLYGDHPIYAKNGYTPVPNTITSVDLDTRRTNGIDTAPSEHLKILPLRPLDWDASAPLDLLGHKF